MNQQKSPLTKNDDQLGVHNQNKARATFRLTREDCHIVYPTLKGNLVVATSRRLMSIFMRNGLYNVDFHKSDIARSRVDARNRTQRAVAAFSNVFSRGLGIIPAVPFAGEGMPLERPPRWAPAIKDNEK